MNLLNRHAEPIFDVIGKYESRNDYNIVYSGIKAMHRPKNLTSLSIQQVMTWQQEIRALGYPSTAAGRFQIISTTLRSVVSQMKLDVSLPFDKDTQDAMALHLLIGRGFRKYLVGTISEGEMMVGLAKEWASLPVPYAMKGQSREVLAGQSYYAGDGLNKAFAKVDEVSGALKECKTRYSSVTVPPTELPDLPTTPEPVETPKQTWLTALLNFLKSLFGAK